MRRVTLLFPFIAVTLWLAEPRAGLAYDLSPIVIQLAPSGAGSSDTVVINASTNIRDPAIGSSPFTVQYRTLDQFFEQSPAALQASVRAGQNLGHEPTS